jgi:hypothetical protein
MNFSTKFEEFKDQLWKQYRRDYFLPDNLAEYVEQYPEDYRQILAGDESLIITGDESLISSYPVQCLPQPGL